MIKPEYLSFLNTLALDWTSRWTGWTQSTPHSRASRGRFGIPRAWPRPLPTSSRLPTMYTSDRSWPTRCARRGLYTPDTCPCNSPSPQSVTQAFNLSATEATQRWHKIAGLLTHAGRTPNGRRRPSV